MPSYYVTGIAGAGKTSVRNELANRGYEAQDTDDFGYWCNVSSGEKVIRPNASHTYEWYRDNKWVLPPDRVTSVLAQYACEQAIFMCGTSSNDAEFSSVFSKIICLTVDQETLRQRLLTRENSDFGKSSAELCVISAWHGELQEHYRKSGAVMIDSQQPIGRIVDEILNATEVKGLNISTTRAVIANTKFY